MMSFHQSCLKQVNVTTLCIVKHKEKLIQKCAHYLCGVCCLPKVINVEVIQSTQLHSLKISKTWLCQIKVRKGLQAW